MNKIILRIIIGVVGLLILIAMIYSLSWSFTDRVIYVGERYFHSNTKCYIVTYGDATLEIRGGDFEIREASKDEFTLTTDYVWLEVENKYLDYSEAKRYCIESSNVESCQAYVKMDGRLAEEIYVFDLFFFYPLEKINNLSFCDVSGRSSFTTSSTKEVIEGFKVFEPIELDFGSSYTAEISSFFPLAFKSQYANDTLHFESFCDDGKGSVGSVSVDSNGNLMVLGTQSGYFKYYSDLMGGIIVPYTINYHDSPIANIIIESYERIHGVRLSSDEITSEITKTLEYLETSSFPTFLTEEMFSILFPNVATLKIRVTGDVENELKCFLPGSLKYLEIVNDTDETVSINASFYGNQSSVIIKMIGDMTINGDGKGATFYDFSDLTIELGDEENYNGIVKINAQNGTSNSINGLNVFENIGKLTLNAISSSCTIKAGDGASNISKRSGDGGYAIQCDVLTVICNRNISIYGGNGGAGRDGYDGKDGYYEGDSFYHYHGGDGGRAGDGGFAVKAKNLIVKNADHDLQLKGGNGGSGGDGGKGGKGAVKKSFFNLIKQYGSGGNGGNGGDGGNGAYSLYLTESLENYGQVYVLESKGGAGGLVGNGGSGGDGDRNGEDGKYKGGNGNSYTWIVLSNHIIGYPPK